MSRKTYHVTLVRSAWRVKGAGAARADSIHETRAQAITRAKRLAEKAALGQVKVHGRNGAIQAEYTYGKDPRRFAG
jgi:Uncharacterized protein conserved in bacteria (DUF2188)